VVNVTTRTKGTREKVTREAATLLYSGVEKEYKQAKLKAAKTFGLHYMPTNREVAIELDRIADENEGSARVDRLIRMRKEALRIMKLLRKYDPILVGSVWRGTIRYDSDLDILVHHDEPKEVTKTIQQTDLSIERTESAAVVKHGKKKEYVHIHVESPIKEKVEVIVHSPEEACLKEKCEIYGDEIKGLRLEELERLLKDDPDKRFIP
jgi:predicted nucleotidyltransferase